MIYESIEKTIGNTPIVRLNRIGQDLGVNLYAKCEFFNPGGSIKDRIGWWLIEDAEKRGLLKPGGTVVEGTSGNTGFGLAIAATIKGYKCIFVLPDKMSNEKISALRAFGAKVVVTPTAVEPEDPRSYYSVSQRLATETPNAVFIGQYNNLANRECHYKTTGPEILKQMPNIDVFMAGIGTGGTICGTGKYLRENKPDCEVVAVDVVGSIVYDKYKFNKDVEAKPYKTEGIGEDFIPDNYDFSVITDMVQVDDKGSALMTRELLLKEGMYSGNSSGSAVDGALKWIKEQGSRLKGKNVLIVLPDSGNRYLSKVYNDDWMREAGFLETESMGTVADVLHVLQFPKDGVISVGQTEKISSVIGLMKDKGISQVPVKGDVDRVKGIVTEEALLKAIYNGDATTNDTVESLVDTSCEFMEPTESVEKASQYVTSGKTPLVMDPSNKNKVFAIITKIDLLTYIGSKSA